MRFDLITEVYIEVVASIFEVSSMSTSMLTSYMAIIGFGAIARPSLLRCILIINNYASTILLNKNNSTVRV